MVKYLVGLLCIFLLGIWGCRPNNETPTKPVKVQEMKVHFNTQVQETIGLDGINFKLPVSAIDYGHSLNSHEVSVYIFDVVEQVARRKTIQIGKTVNNYVDVLSGLQEGEQVIIAGVPFLKDGQRVKRWQSTSG